MAKILTDKELGEIIQKAVNDPAMVEERDTYIHFLEDLGDLIAQYFGGERRHVYFDEGDDLGYTVSFQANECVPDDGGVFKHYDTDVTWESGEEVEG